MLISSSLISFRFFVCLFTAIFFIGCAFATSIGQLFAAWRKLNKKAPPLMYTSRFILAYCVGLILTQLSLAAEYLFFAIATCQLSQSSTPISHDLFIFYTRYFDKIALTFSLVSGWCITSYHARTYGSEALKRNLYCVLEACCTFLYCFLLCANISSSSPSRYITNLELEMGVIEVVLIFSIIVIYSLLSLYFKVKKNYRKHLDLSYSNLMSKTLEKNLRSLEKKTDGSLYSIFIELCFLFSHGLLIFIPRCLYNQITGFILLVVMTIFYAKLLHKSRTITLSTLVGEVK